MKWNIALPLVAAFACACPTLADAEEKANVPSSAVVAATLTRQQFEALPPTAMIEVDGQRMSKEEFLKRRLTDLNRAIKQMEDWKSRAEAEFAAYRKAFLDGEKAKLDEANKKVHAEVDRLLAADAAAHGPEWDARKKQAAALLTNSAAADPQQRSQLEKQAADLLAPLASR